MAVTNRYANKLNTLPSPSTANVKNTYFQPRQSTTTSPYFDYVGYKEEQNLYMSLVQENVALTGIDVYYLPRAFLSIDPVLGEPLKSSFNKAYKIEAYIESSSDGYSGDDIATKFGIGAGCDVTLIISKQRWQELKVNEVDFNHPQEGDLIYIGSGSSEFSIDYFEITYVDYQKFFFQLGKSMTYALNCVAFTFNYENFSTGVPEVDQINQQTDNASEVDLGENKGVNNIGTSLLVTTERNPFGGL